MAAILAFGPAAHAAPRKPHIVVLGAVKRVPYSKTGDPSGAATGEDAVAMLMAGANALEVGTATFADPRAPWRVLRALEHWMRRHDVARVQDLIGVAHD